jgi:hypothetical protein
MKSNSGRVIFFSDEKTFTVDRVINPQNDWFVAFTDTPEDNPRRYNTATKHPASLMMLSVVASTGDVLPPIWFPTGFRLSTVDYIDVMQRKVIPWIKRVAVRGD